MGFRRTLPFLLGLLAAGPAAGQEEDASAICQLCHGEVLEQTEAPGVHPLESCLDCHSGLAGFDFSEGQEHPLDRAAADCSSCHDQGHDFAATPHADAGLDCAACHGGHAVQAAARWREAGGLDDCLLCHEDVAAALGDSVHRPYSAKDRRPYPGCLDCHADIHTAGAAEVGALDRKRAFAAACGDCHEKDVQGYDRSPHHRLLVDEGRPDAPGCVECHGGHAVLRHKDNAAEVSERCQECHRDYGLSLHHAPGQQPPDLHCTVCHSGHLPTADSIADKLFPAGGLQNCSYCHSTDQHQGADLAHDNASCSAAMGREVHCVDCHTFHWKVVNGQPVPGTSHQSCESCHVEEGAAWRDSVHGRSRAAGNLESPYCTDCHGERGGVLKAAVEFANGKAVEHCEKCHGDRALMLSFGVNPYAVSGFRDTYHGELYDVANTGKDKSFATCAACHGHHDILEPEDPLSTVSEGRLLGTCRQCHQDAEQKFVSYVAHPRRPKAAEVEAALASAPPRFRKAPRGGAIYADPGLRTAEDGGLQAMLEAADVAMKGLFFTVMAFFLLHTLLWFQKGVRQRYGPRRIYYRRFGPYDRMLHIMVNVSFLALAFTGLPQTFSHTTMGRWVLDHVMSIEQAQQVHYWAAALTGLYFGLHLLQVGWRLRRRGWRKVLWGPDSLVPRIQDLKDFLQHMGWFLGRCQKPRFDRWTYWEKFDYFAVFWGVAVIGLSGLVRWQEEWFGNLFGGGVVSIATTIHKEEALLATAFIFAVHFFNTHLRSEKFPMDVSIYTGLVTEHELQEERPRQFERMLAGGKLEQLRVHGRSNLAVWLAYLWGTIALTLGLTMLVMIVLGFLSH